MSDVAAFGTPTYGINRALPGVAYEDAVERTKVALAANGFGVLTTIDISATLKKKLDVDVRPYVILGACNPKMAYAALQLEGPIGLLLPCNVIVVSDGEGGSIVSAVDPEAMFEVVGRPEISSVAVEVSAMLKAAVAAV